MSREVYGGEELDTDAFSAFALEPDAIQALREADYCPEIQSTHTVVSVKDEANSSHLVFKVQCLTKPIARADAVKDQCTLWVCSCRGYFFHRMRSTPSDDEILPPLEIRDHDDPHVQAVSKHKKAESDDSQETLL